MDRQAAWIVVYELRAGLFPRRSWPPRAPTACAAIGQPYRVANPAPTRVLSHYAATCGKNTRANAQIAAARRI
jgi:hypothetical protein